MARLGYLNHFCQLHLSEPFGACICQDKGFNTVGAYLPSADTGVGLNFLFFLL
jgi:hypothetical protein